MDTHEKNASAQRLPLAASLGARPRRAGVTPPLQGFCTSKCSKCTVCSVLQSILHRWSTNRSTGGASSFFTSSLTTHDGSDLNTSWRPPACGVVTQEPQHPIDDRAEHVARTTGVGRHTPSSSETSLSGSRLSSASPDVGPVSPYRPPRSGACSCLSYITLRSDARRAQYYIPPPSVFISRVRADLDGARVSHAHHLELLPRR
jgi:hypothetical protein